MQLCSEFEEANENIKPMMFSQQLAQRMFDEQARMDTVWALGSISFVFLYFVIHLRSIFLASFSILLILFSFPVTQIIYSGALGITYFSTLHVMVIFIVLGISADDIFVIVDAWRQSEFI